MVSNPLGLPRMGLLEASLLPPHLVRPLSPGPSLHRHSLQQVLLLCAGILVMVLFSLFVE